MVEKQNIELKLIHMEDVVSKEVKWLQGVGNGYVTDFFLTKS